MNVLFSKQRQKGWYVLILLSFFVLGEQVRRGIYSALSLNFVFFICMCVLLVLNRKNLYFIRFCIVSALIVHATILNVVSGCSIDSVIRCIVVYFCPLYLLTINYEFYKLDFYDISVTCLKIINFFMIFICCCYFFDIVTNGMFIKTIGVKLYTVKNWVPTNVSIFRSRYPSYMGHYLYTGELYLIFFILNSCFKLKTNKWIMKPRWIYLVYFVGTLSTASKTCTMLMILAITINILWGSKKYRMLKLIGAFIIFILLYMLGAFDFVLSRIFEADSITTGRAEAWEYLRNRNMLHFSLFEGPGMNLEREWGVSASTDFNLGYTAVKQTSIALEYPLIANFFRYGIVNNSITIILMYIIPVKKQLKAGNYYIAICLTILFVDVNTFNLLTQGMDAMLVYIFTVVMLNFIGNVTKSD